MNRGLVLLWWNQPGLVRRSLNVISEAVLLPLELLEIGPGISTDPVGVETSAEGFVNIVLTYSHPM